MPLADEVLLRLLKRGEGASLRASGRAVQERFKDPGSGYWRLPLDERDRCHERFRAAERAGGVSLTWAGQGGDDRPIEIVRLRDHGRLAAFLGLDTVAAAVAKAEDMLAPWRQHVARVGDLIERWSVLKNVRGLPVTAAADFVDALRVLDALQARRGEDQVLRTLSAQLFGDSKRIEQLERHLDILTAESLAAPVRHWSEVYGALGLVKEPQPFLVAGAGTLRLAGAQLCPVVKPYVGVSNQAITGYSGGPGWILTIENLTTFHLASQLPPSGTGLILYTAGMPSPSWCAAYRRILSDLPLHVPALHWGDIDVGGFRIAAHLRDQCESGRRFMPWLMDSRRMPSVVRVEVPEAALRSMRIYAHRAGWSDLADGMDAVAIEQEAIPPELPGVP